MWLYFGQKFNDSVIVILVIENSIVIIMDCGTYVYTNNDPILE